MKILISILMLIAYNSFAQPSKGTYVVGGSASLSFNKSPNVSSKIQSTSFSISPGIGKFISEKYQLEVGLGFGYLNQINQANSDNFNQQRQQTLSIRFGATRFIPIVDKLYFTIGANIVPSYIISNVSSASFGVKSESDFNDISGNLIISPGLTYFINKKWMLYSSIGVLNYQVTYDLDTELVGHSFYANVSANSFNLGVRYIIGSQTN